MKLLITSRGKFMDSMVDPRFGRCRFFVIMETNGMKMEAFANRNTVLKRGAGVKAAEFAVSKEVRSALTGTIGPYAFRILKNAGIKVFTGISGTIADAASDFNKKELKVIKAPSVRAKFGANNIEK
jgi:predicted Fe-Mo cluster-binding NifX family protein